MSNSELSDNSDANPDLKPEARSFGNKFVLKTVLILLLVSVSGIGVISWYLDQINNIHVVDARIDTEMKTISSSTAGNIISLNVKEGDKVTSVVWNKETQKKRLTKGTVHNTTVHSKRDLLSISHDASSKALVSESFLELFRFGFLIHEE